MLYLTLMQLPYRGANAEPDDVPDCFGDKKETVAFDVVEDFFIFVIHLNFPFRVLSLAFSGDKTPIRKNGRSKNRPEPDTL